MGQFEFKKVDISGILVITPRAFQDDRGYFMECYTLKDFLIKGFTKPFLQDNLSRSKKGVVRGLHYQLKQAAMGKLVKCVSGRIFDVGVDIRQGSPTFGKWYGEILSEENQKMIYFPPGFAHGFLALEDDTRVHYKCTGLYSQKDERAILWNDPDLKIDWPLAEVGGAVILSEKDKVHPCLKAAETNHSYPD